MDAIPEILNDLKAGRMVVLVDDESRENEGDLVCAAEHASPEVINFMLSEGRGMLFVALDAATCERLDLQPPVAVNTTQRGTAYTVSIDAAARHGVTTGVSTLDRSITIRKLADPDATIADFDRPGHVQPLRARKGGSLVRAGHTEASVDLCRMAGLRPAAVGIEVMNADGTMSRGPELHELCERHDLKITSVDHVIAHRLTMDRLVERVADTTFDSEFGRFRLIAYRSAVDPFPHVALVCGGVGDLDPAGQPVPIDEPVLVRVHSQNLLGDVLGDLGQPSGQTLHTAMRMIQQRGRGAVVYLRHEGMGKGLVKQLQTGQGRNDEDRPLIGQGQSAPMDYGIGSQILRDLGLRRLELITNHPLTPNALSGFGLTIERFVPVPKPGMGP